MWIAEYSTRNMVGGPFQVEDTERYALQKACLARLARSGGVSVTYRPYRAAMEWDGTTRWLQRSGGVRIDALKPLLELIVQHDVMVTDTSSGTVWGEVLAVGKPLILYVDPEQVRLMPDFTVMLERACRWCRTADELTEAVDELASQPAAALAALRRADPSAFLRRYVLGDHPSPAERTLSFLSTVCRGRRTLEAWEGPMRSAAAVG